MDGLKGFILCGGQGSRLRPLTYYFQKVMIPIGTSQKPLLEYAVKLLRYYDIQDIVLLVGYKAEQIENYFADGRRFDVKLSYVHDRLDGGGTGWTVVNAYETGAISDKDLLVVYYGDILSNINIKKLVEYHKEKKAAATVVLAGGFELSVGVTNLMEDSRIKSFIEKPKLEKPVSVGILTLSGSILNYVRDLAQKSEKLDLMGDVIPSLIKDNLPVYGYITDAFWVDVGSMERYEKLNSDIVEEKLGFLFEK